MQKHLLTATILLSLFLFPFHAANCSENEEGILSDYEYELEQISAEADEAVSGIGPIEFRNFSELSDIENVLYLKQNLEEYWKAKKDYFDKVDALLNAYREKMGQIPEEHKRLEGTAYRLLEQLEQEYVTDLDRFYDLVIRNHDKMSFEEGRFFLDDEKLVIILNSLWKKALQSTRDLVAAVD